MDIDLFVFNQQLRSFTYSKLFLFILMIFWHMLIVAKTIGYCYCMVQYITRCMASIMSEVR